MTGTPMWSTLSSSSEGFAGLPIVTMTFPWNGPSELWGSIVRVDSCLSTIVADNYRFTECCDEMVPIPALRRSEPADAIPDRIYLRVQYARVDSER